MIYSNYKEARVNRRNTVSIGNICFPSNIKENDDSRKAYVASCLRTETTCIVTRDGEFISNALIGKTLLDKIQFPDTYPNLGSTVLIMTEPVYNQALITEIFNNSDSDLQKENNFNLKRNTKKGSVSITGDGDNGNLFISVNSEEKGGNIYVNLNNTNKDSKLILNVSGTIEINTTDNININSAKQISLNRKLTEDENFSIILDESKLYIGDNSASEPFVLGNKNKASTEAILDAISALTVPTALGPSGIPINIADFTKAKTDLTDTLSTTSFIKE